MEEIKNNVHIWDLKSKDGWQTSCASIRGNFTSSNFHNSISYKEDGKWESFYEPSKKS